MNIDFYILDSANRQQSLLFACRLVEKLYMSEQHIYIHTESPRDAERIDALLWTYRDDSFLPHNQYDPNATAHAPIQIGFNDKPAHHNDVLINLTDAIPTFYQSFVRLIEIVFSEAHTQQLARERYRQYRDNGNHLNTHKLKASDL